eukprot:NODE_3345_length_368_cov_41.416928_g3263_i0.p1 GENE.NODE_3345_length_368_cov_41.416928_g3263_i0~~NODE_3345_length_368_cov_41.416928_g3263_i0.p1  ORF type:complete len:110 (-),score=4.36 NODE_3345_length_368_cov_41.416928_g3263_i0:7-336(-)
MGKIDAVSDIIATSSNSTVLYNFDFDILKYTQENNINSAVVTKNLQEVIYASTFDVKYIIVKKNIAKEAQNIANNYMLDSKILVIIETNDEIVENAIDEIDGVIYNKVI